MAIKIKWNRRALKQFDDAIEHIESETPAGAEKVRNDILLRIDSLTLNTPSCQVVGQATNNGG
jgi:plasmid stabilization system protein ParE